MARTIVWQEAYAHMALLERVPRDESEESADHEQPSDPVVLGHGPFHIVTETTMPGVGTEAYVITRQEYPNGPSFGPLAACMFLFEDELVSEEPVGSE